MIPSAKGLLVRPQKGPARQGPTKRTTTDDTLPQTAVHLSQYNLDEEMLDKLVDEFSRVCSGTELDDEQDTTTKDEPLVYSTTRRKQKYCKVALY